MKYRILQSRFTYELQRTVEQFIKNGWEPLGGVAIEGIYGPRIYYQAMIFKEKLNDKI